LAPTVIQVKDACPDPECWIEVFAEKYDVDVNVAKSVARCESQMGKFKKNWSGSSAEGLFMFMPRTFDANCNGDIKSDKDQTECFMHLFKEHPNYWEQCL